MLKQLTLAAAVAAFSISADAQSCTRASLKTMLDNYFKAVETHALSALPTAANLRITENGQEVKPGEGFLKSGGKVQLRRDVLDAQQCGAAAEAVTDETVDGMPTLAVMAVRLKVEGGKVSEIETIVTREKEQKTFYNPKALLDTKDQDWTTPLPAAKRLTREVMNAGANQYFSDFTNDPAVPEGPFAMPCERWEGGLQTTAKTHSCSPKGTNLVLNHTHRRFPVTDTETGIIAGFMNFGGGLPDVHIFKYNADGKIYLINAVFGGRVQGGAAVWPDEKK